jgi:tRNA (cmo5U34)-methyltransferase
MTTEYRWNTSDFAKGYDEAAHNVHPHYLPIQDAILNLLPESASSGLIVDLGGGSGRLIERILRARPDARAVVVDQSEPFLAIAERRLAPFGPRAVCVLARLQAPWSELLPGKADAIVSMSAIHHLEPAEKRALYQECHAALGQGGVLLNGDEIRSPDDAEYLADLTAWARHMRTQMDSGKIPDSFCNALEAWIDRNVNHFGEKRKSGDDCHETIEVQLEYLRGAGFAAADCPWRESMWAVLRGVK